MSTSSRRMKIMNSWTLIAPDLICSSGWGKSLSILLRLSKDCPQVLACLGPLPSTSPASEDHQRSPFIMAPCSSNHSFACEEAISLTRTRYITAPCHTLTHVHPNFPLWMQFGMEMAVGGEQKALGGRPLGRRLRWVYQSAVRHSCARGEFLQSSSRGRWMRDQQVCPALWLSSATYCCIRCCSGAEPLQAISWKPQTLWKKLATYTKLLATLFRIE